MPGFPQEKAVQIVRPHNAEREFASLFIEERQALIAVEMADDPLLFPRKGGRRWTWAINVNGISGTIAVY
jgi:hypothetical protein